MAQIGVHEPGGMRRCEQDPGGGEVPVAEAQPVRLVDGAGECLDDLGRRQDGKRPSFEVFAEILSLHELRDQEFGSVMTTARKDGDDVRVMQPRRTGVEVDEANVSGGPIPLGFDHLQGDATIPRQLTGLVDHACPTASQDTKDRVPWDRGERGPPRRRVRAVARRLPRWALSPALADRSIGGQGVAAADETSQSLIVGPVRGVVVEPPAVALRTNEFRGNPNRHR